MKLKEIYIKNFRGIKDLHLKLNHPTTILIGENNTGKTTILEAVKIVLNRQRISKGNIFSAHDYFCENDSNDGLDKQILIELWFREDQQGEWSEEITNVELNDIVQLDLNSNLYSLGIRLKSVYDKTEKISNPSWYWLGNDGGEIKEINSTHTTFFKIVQFFYLDALRDASTSFSGGSKFWKQFLKLDLTPAEEEDFVQQLQTMNDTILAADPKVARLKNELDAIPTVVSNDIDKVSIEAFPEKPWDLSNKAKLFVKTKGSGVALPINRFGQGTQSLSVLMLFKAYAEILMQANTHEQAFALIGLEEPEVHLHPHAVRSLWNFLQTQLSQQKIVSTHSTFFIQEADLTSLRLLKRKEKTVEVFHIKRSYETKLPAHPDLTDFCDKNEKYDFSPIGTEGMLTLREAMSEDHFKKLCTIYAGNSTAQTNLRKLQNASSIYLSDDDLLDLKYYTERIRGEVFFAKAWLLCEGQTEYLLLRYFARLMGKDFDQKGISVIDYKNNGSAGLFIVLAKHFDMPWVLISDNDQAYVDTLKEIKRRKIPQSDIDDFVETFSTPDTDIECFLYDEGFKNHYLDVLSDELIFPPNTSTVSVGKVNKNTDASLLYKNDGTSIIKIKVADNTEIELSETENGYEQLYPKILKKNTKTEEEMDALKNTADFTNQPEVEILSAKIGNIEHELKLQKNPKTYSIDLTIHGKTKTIDASHADYDELLRFCMVIPKFSLIKKNKVLHTQKLIRKLQKDGATDSSVPQFFKNLINKVISII